MISTYILFYLIILLFLLVAYITRTIGFNNLIIRREIDNNRILEGETCKISTIIENKKRFPIAFLILREYMTQGIEYEGEEVKLCDEGRVTHVSKYRVGGRSRKVRTYKIKAKRGAYLIKDLTVEISDVFAMNTETREFKELIELLVYPKVIPLSNINFDVTNFSGDNTVRRWIQKDDLYVRGIREYGVEDRMKDIHWKSSLKMSKLMVKDYDFTAESELVIIFNIQCNKNHWQNIDEESIENGIKIAASLAVKSIGEGISTGFWTNARIISNENEFQQELRPMANNYKRILELCARIHYGMLYSFTDYIKMRANNFERSCTYIIITSYLDDESLQLLKEKSKGGINLKIVDTSKNGDVKNIKGIEKICFKGMKI
ncbi:DUF58 domain-containing protein [Clostridium ihumii]|uniref:DUF58 domain-containing protein n=1 Tax=Clostridium ihumii TaxID=1470356 RepID=UPI0005912341|nr:DUF58 domain-containing protein [Clostridium ihumii]